MAGETQAKYANWIQFALLLISLIVLAMHGEGRLSKLEQRFDDADKDRGNMIERLGRIEDKLESWRSTPH